MIFMARKKVKKRVKIGKFHKLLYVFAITLTVSLPVTVVFSKAALSEINFQVEKQKKEIKLQTKKNESLSMKINELASLDKIQEVAKDEGLSYNNNNIKTVEDEKQEDN